jgi:RNA-directed DNA polymerase
MKRHGDLWTELTSYSNLLRAARQAQKGKRFRENVLDFNYHLEFELEQLQLELLDQTYEPGEYHTFRIFDPKPRLISAAPYRDRVVHHALCNLIIPPIDRTFIHTSYANRLGYGSHRALQQFTAFARSSCYVLQCDIRKYFPCIDHEILKSQLHQKIKCTKTAWLIDLLIDSSNPQEEVCDYFPGDQLFTPLERRHGLPIGNLTSQFFANVYLNQFDHFVKEELKISKYLRYVDDFALFSDDHALLTSARVAIEEFLVSLRLKIHPIKSQLFATKVGASFLGFRVLPDRIRVRNDNLRRGRRRLRKQRRSYGEGSLELVKFAQSLQSWEAHLKHGNTYRLRQRIFDQFTQSPIL